VGEFKPMVKMETTEPSIELKLKKGGSVAHKPMKGKADSQKTVKKAMGGGLGAVSPVMALPSAPMDEMPSRTPKRPSLAERRKAMMMAKMMGRKKGGSAEGTKAEEKAESKAEHAKEMKAGKGKNYKTGGVVNGQGGYKTGGVIKGQAGYKDGGSTGDVKLGNGGGYKTGGATKKFADGGSAVKMPQGSKPVPKPVYINELAGTYKKGGKVKKYSEGGSDSDNDAMQRANTRGYNNTFKNETDENEADAKAVRDAIMYVPNKIKGLYDKAKNGLRGQGAVTDTERTLSRTVTPPAQKRGGRAGK
jgi:hypothetical protein